MSCRRSRRLKGPVFETGPCAGYRLTLRADGTAEYTGEKKVPSIGSRRGTLDKERFTHLALLIREIGVDQLNFRTKARSNSWSCVQNDGEGPIEISMTFANGQTACVVDEDPMTAFSAPELLTVVEREIDRMNDFVQWQ